MWHTPNQRVRALASQKKRERERARKPIHVKRISVQVEVVSPSSEPQTPPPSATEVRLVLNDLSPKGVGLFSPVGLIPGNEIRMKFVEPMEATLKARVIWCQNHVTNSHIISANAYSFRVGVEFLAETPEETQAISTLIEVINKDHIFSLKGV